MLVYGDRSRTVAPLALLLEIEGRLAAARDSDGIPRRDRLTRVLIDAGELAQGVADAEFDAAGEDDVSPAAEATMALAAAIAAELLAASGQPAVGSNTASAVAAIRALPAAAHPLQDLRGLCVLRHLP